MSKLFGLRPFWNMNYIAQAYDLAPRSLPPSTVRFVSIVQTFKKYFKALYRRISNNGCKPRVLANLAGVIRLCSVPTPLLSVMIACTIKVTIDRKIHC